MDILGRTSRVAIMLLTSALLLLAGACSSSGPVDGLLDGFAEAAANNEEALVLLDQSIVKELAAIRTEQAIEGSRQVVVDGKLDKERVLVRPFGENGCNFDDSGCQLRLLSQQEARSGDEDAGYAFGRKSHIPELIAAARDINIYAASLKAIAQSDNTDAVKEASSKAMSGICGLAATAASAGAALVSQPVCTAFAVPVSSLVAFVYGEYEMRVKLGALRDATDRMQPVLAAAGEHFSAAARAGFDVQIRKVFDQYTLAQDKWREGRSEAKLKTLLEAAEELHAALKTQAAVGSRESVFIEFVTAHEQVRRALKEPNFDFATAIAAVRRLVEKTKELVNVAKSFKEAADKAKALTGGN